MSSAVGGGSTAAHHDRERERIPKAAVHTSAGAEEHRTCLPPVGGRRQECRHCHQSQRDNDDGTLLVGGPNEPRHFTPERGGAAVDGWWMGGWSMPRVLWTSFLVFSAGLAAEVTLDCTQLGRCECLTSAQSQSHQFRSWFGGAGSREAAH